MRDRLEEREAAHAVAAELGLHVDVRHDLGREDPAPAEDVLARGCGLVGHRVAPACARRARACRSCRAACRRRTSGAGRRSQPVDPELALDELGVRVGPLAGHAVDAERLDLAADVDRPVVHRVAEPGADVAEEDHPAALHHEAGHRAGAAEHDDRAALLVDAGARADLALDHEVAAADRGTRQRARVPVDDDDPRHHVLADRPAHAPLDVDLGPVDQAEAEVAERAVEGEPAAREDPDPERVLGARVPDGDVLHALLVEEPAELEVDLPRRELLRVERGGLAVDLGDHRHRGVRLGEPARVVPDLRLAYRCHTRTSRSYGSYVSISRSTIARIAISSDASATRSSPSYRTSGFAAISSFATPSASAVTAM